MENQKRAAKELLQAGKKDRALLILKKKRLLENLINRSLNQLNTLEKMVYSIEEASMQATVVEGLKSGNEALKEINKMFSIDEVEKIMDETREAAEYQEVSFNSGAQLTENDMEEVNAELEALVAGETENLQFPAVPSEPLPSREEKEKSIS
ncbi:unnamed protein product [Enterobius vermicularis]|uniref:Charged multivesicular body protein 6 n=1 Tax=Enterobius vermicularis TaxID=51028 RepID=A0A0N4V3E2_ENTVE|nr:unnamed protein product [Enterobius vermicularis]